MSFIQNQTIKSGIKFTFKTFIASIVFLSVLGLFFGGFLFLIIVFFASIGSNVEPTLSDSSKFIYKYLDGKESSKNKILSIKINGVILSNVEEGSGLLDFVSDQITYGYQIKDMLIKASDNKDIKGIILEINSPGGTVTGSQAIYDGVKYFKEKTHKPVYTHIQGLAASGAVWSSVGSDKIYADVGSFIGSIGVISGPFKYYNKVLSESGSLFSDGVVTQNGIDSFNITAGKYKDFGNPYRKMTDEELQTMQTAINNSYSDFVALVSSNRKISEDKIKNDLKALIYDNKQAKEFGLIDATESREGVLAAIVKELKISEDDYQVVRMKPKQGKLESLLEITTSFRGQKAALTTRGCVSNTRIMAYYGDVNGLCR